MGEKLFEILDILDDDGTIFMLMTNGTMINEDKVSRVKKYRYHWFQLSIDGADPAYHDWFRGQTGCWDKAVNAAKMVSKSGIPLKIAHCVTPLNISKLDDMFELAYEIGASSIIAGGISLSGRAGDNKELLLNRDQERELWEKIKENRAKYDGRIKIKTTNEVKSGLLRHAERPRSNAVIRPNGDVRIDDMAPFVIGNILEDDFETIWENKIDKCWKDSRVVDYINGFDADDRNFKVINYMVKDVFI